MPRLLRWFAFSLLLLPVALRADVTGTWSGTYTATATTCMPPQQTGGSITMALMQNGTAVTGTMVVEVGLADCAPVSPPIPVGIPVNGSLQGSSLSLSGAVAVPGTALTASVMGTVNGTTMNLSFSGGDTSGTAMLTQTSTAPPDSGLSGTYTGTYNAVIVPCGKLAPLPYSGTLTASLTQAGATVSGPLTGTGFKKDHEDQNGVCTVTDDDQPPPLFFSAQISGTTVAGIVIEVEKGKTMHLLGQISGTTITGHIEGELTGEFVDFTISRTSTAAGPAIIHFDANPGSINAGQSSTLSWSTLNATSVTIDNGVGAQSAIGSVTVSPSATTTYTLTAAGGGTSVTAQATVTVSGGGGPNVAVSAFPHGMIQAAGVGGGADSFSLTNVGASSTDLTLSASGGFFTISPQSLTLPAGATRTVSINGTPQAANSYSGSVTVNGNGANGLTVPVRLLSANPPSGTVVASAAVSRSDVSSSAGQNPSGSVNFTNSGSSTLQGIAVSDVPWIIPQSGIVTIPPGQTVAVTFTIDSAKRPDAASPLGAVTGSISLVFIAGATSGKEAMSSTPTGNASVTIVYVVAPGVTTGTPPPLAAGEIALFVPGMANTDTALGDLFIANTQGGGPLSNLKLYFQTSPGTPFQVASLPAVAANAVAAFPGLPKNVFTGTQMKSGTAQICGTDLSKVAVSALQYNTNSPVGSFGTALPVFRSDRGIDSGGQMIISGVSKQTGSRTDIYLQEVTGNPAMFSVEFIDQNGTIGSSRQSGSLFAFGSLTVADSTIPANTVALRITNGSGGGRINAYALVQDLASGDAWVISDPAVNALPSDDTFFFPVLSAGSGAQSLLYVTNRTGSPASVTVDSHTVPRRLRAVTHSVQTPFPLGAFNLNPYQSLATLPIDSSVAYERIVSAPGAVSVNARTTRSSGGNTFGSGLPALPASAAIVSGGLKRFAGVEDASPRSRAAAAPGTFRSNLTLIEVANQTATVRVTLRYTFVAGATVAAGGVSAKEYSVSAGQDLTINDIVRDVIGLARDSFGDLHNMELDVEVTGGSGSILPFLQTIDNGSGDSVVRTD